MSSVKEYFFEVEQERFLDWAGNRLDRKDLEDESEAWRSQ